MDKKIAVSGIRPTGNLHFGNYFGAVKNFIELQSTHQCYFFIANYHSLTTHTQSLEIKNSGFQIVCEYLAMGLDPEKAVLYLQSDLPQTAELYLFLNMLAYKGELERVSTFKEKAKKHPDNVNAGLLTYPTLMAADILIHNADVVPVGQDQKQHIEMTRDFAQRFNHLYKKEVFNIPTPMAIKGDLIRVPGLTAQGKMSKSNAEKDAIFFTDQTSVLKKKIMAAVSDDGPKSMNSIKSIGVQNIFDLLNLVSNEETIHHFETLYNNCSIRYGDLKKQLFDDAELFIAPIREKIEYYKSKPNLIEDVLSAGKAKANLSAEATMKVVRETLGF